MTALPVNFQHGHRLQLFDVRPRARPGGMHVSTAGVNPWSTPHSKNVGVRGRVRRRLGAMPIKGAEARKSSSIDHPSIHSIPFGLKYPEYIEQFPEHLKDERNSRTYYIYSRYKRQVPSQVVLLPNLSINMRISLLFAALLACALTMTSGNRPFPHHHLRAELVDSNIRTRQLAQVALQGSLDIRRINCPIMSALVKNGDLVTNAEGEVTKAEVVVAMRDVGIAEDVLTAAADGNFDHLPEPKIIGTINLGKFAKPVTVAKPVWHSRAFPPPTRICTAPRNLTSLATPVGKSPNTAIQRKKTQITTLQEQGKALQEKLGAGRQKIAELRKEVEQLETEAMKSYTNEEEQQKQHEREAMKSRLSRTRRRATHASVLDDLPDLVSDSVLMNLPADKVSL
eukprot:gene16584-22819_t